MKSKAALLLIIATFSNSAFCQSSDRSAFVKNTQIGDLICNSSPDTMAFIVGTSIIGAHVEAVSSGKFKVSIAFIKFQSKDLQTNIDFDSVKLTTGESIKVGSLTWMDSSSVGPCN